jgi:hypothetical protein
MIPDITTELINDGAIDKETDCATCIICVHQAQITGRCKTFEIFYHKFPEPAVTAKDTCLATTEIRKIFPPSLTSLKLNQLVGLQPLDRIMITPTLCNYGRSE